MYTVTFYSFKGGVGRSMALINAGVQLAQKGKKVLLVDFDLEAPGLTTFALNQPKVETRGIVDYVHEYLSTGISPLANDFCYKAAQFAGDGQVWIMPSGLTDSKYSNHFNSINWLDLYKNKDGFLLFEDLKLQWESEIGAEYVLIDSRTGHSDVEGICTRQLPNAVCFLFFPNEQNLEGLKRVTSSVRTEYIMTHFVASNTPDLDDEDGILRDTLTKFRQELKYKTLAAEIHHYQSLTLLNQDVFSLTRPNSRLTKEYEQLVDAIVSENLEDRDAALGRLKNMRRDFPEERIAGVRDSRNVIERILSNFPIDPEVRLQSALSYEFLGETQDAIDLLTAATIENSNAPALGYAARARLFSRKGAKFEVADSLKSMLNSSGVDLATVLDAASLINAQAPQLLETFGASKAVLSLPREERFLIALQNDGDVAQLRSQVAILKSLLEDTSTPHDAEYLSRPALQRQIGVAYIGLGQFDMAVSQLQQPIDSGEKSISSSFNFAMAKWGQCGLDAAIPHMHRVVELDRQDSSDHQPNYLQCLALANFVAGDLKTGQEFLSASRAMMTLRSRREFSCWSYLRVDADTFLAHLDQIEKFSTNKEVTPVFVSRGTTDFFGNSPV